MIIAAALDDVGRGKLGCVDPNPDIAPDLWQKICGRGTMIVGGSPEVLGDAAKALGGRFSLVFIDGDHSKPGVMRDIEGVLPWLEDSAYLLFHDVYYREVAEGITAALLVHSDCLTDCGLLSKERVSDTGNPDILWGGLQLVRFVRSSRGSS
jgi:predicted O-methyltransferase YrrM